MEQTARFQFIHRLKNTARIQKSNSQEGPSSNHSPPRHRYRTAPSCTDLYLSSPNNRCWSLQNPIQSPVGRRMKRCAPPRTKKQGTPGQTPQHNTAAARSYLDDVKDLPGSLLHLAHLVHEVPELRGAGHLVGREHLTKRRKTEGTREDKKKRGGGGVGEKNLSSQRVTWCRYNTCFDCTNKEQTIRRQRQRQTQLQGDSRQIPKYDHTRLEFRSRSCRHTNLRVPNTSSLGVLLLISSNEHLVVYFGRASYPTSA